jgi:hypothetical protein
MRALKNYEVGRVMCLACTLVYVIIFLVARGAMGEGDMFGV